MLDVCTLGYQVNETFLSVVNFSAYRRDAELYPKSWIIGQIPPECRQIRGKSVRCCTKPKQDWNKERPMPFSRYGTKSSGGYQVVENDFKQISNYLKTIAERYSGVKKNSVDKVFCVGYRRTGTSSFSEAMKILGYKHCTWDPVVWDWYKRGKFRTILRHAKYFDSFDDLPWSIIDFVKIIDKTFPNSKFVLLERDPDEWIISFEKFKIKLGGSCFNEEYKKLRIEMFIERNNLIKTCFCNRPRDFLEINVAGDDSFERLCHFLGLEAIQAEFPHLNKSSS